MDEESVLAPEAGPEVVADEAIAQPEGQADGQTAPQDPEGDSEEKKSAARERREREKAQKLRVRQELEETRAKLAQAEKRLREAEGLEVLSDDLESVDPLDPNFAQKTAKLARKEIREELATEAVSTARAELDRIEAEARDMVSAEWARQVDEAKSRYADFEKVAFAPNVPVTPGMAELIATSDVGADLAYFLGSNREIAREISMLPPTEAARALGRIEASLTAPKPRTETQAPAPIAPVKGTAGATRNPDKMSYTEWVKWREAGGRIG